MSIIAVPGSNATALISNSSAGLVGTIGVTLLKSNGTIQTARTTAGIVDLGLGSYAATILAPTVGGTYIVKWDTGGGSPVETVEDFIVSYSASSAATPAGYDLCALADLREYLQKASTDTAQDTALQHLITRASTVIMRYCDHEFAPSSSSGTVRTMRYSPNPLGIIDLAPWDLQSASLVRLNPEAGSPVTLTANVQYTLTPVGAPRGVYTSLRLSPLATAAISQTLLYFGYQQVEVTGTWGFPTVPDDVRQACVVTAANWFRADVARFTSTAAPSDSVTFEVPQSIPGRARALLAPWRRSFGV